MSKRGHGFGRPGGWQQADLPVADDAAAWVRGRVPDGWFVEPPEVLVDREEIVIIGRIQAPPGVPDAAASDAKVDGEPVAATASTTVLPAQDGPAVRTESVGQSDAGQGGAGQGDAAQGDAAQGDAAQAQADAASSETAPAGSGQRDAASTDAADVPADPDADWPADESVTDDEGDSVRPTLTKADSDADADAWTPPAADGLTRDAGTRDAGTGPAGAAAGESATRPPGGRRTSKVSAEEAGRIARFREETRNARIHIARQAEERYGRRIAWGARCGGTYELFTNISVPVMTRLRQNERRVLDTLVDAGVARSRSEALAWCVRLVGQNTDDWLRGLRTAMSEVDRVRSQGPTV